MRGVGLFIMGVGIGILLMAAVIAVVPCMP